MAKIIAENERVKRQYLDYLRHAKGQDESSLDKVNAALWDFEDAIGRRPFKAFHRDWAARYKKHLSGRKNARTGTPLSYSTRDASLRILKGFVHWLASQPGYKSRVTYADAEYFNNNANDARAARAQSQPRFPSLQQCRHAFEQMPAGTEVERRDKAIFAFVMLTGARVSAVASMPLGNVDLVEGQVFQDGRVTRTKNRKTFPTWFFPVDEVYREVFETWVRYLRDDLLFGPGDPLFPKQRVGVADGGGFSALGLDRAPYANGQPINAIIKSAYSSAGLHPFTAHSLRKTLARLGDERCQSMEQHKAWSQNLGHDNISTTVSAYLPVGPERQGELIKGLSEK